MGGANDYHTLKTIYNGEIVEFCFDDWSVLSNSDADYPCTSQTQAGHPGIMSYDSITYIKNFSVKLNNNTLAPMLTSMLIVPKHPTPIHIQ